MSIEGSIKTLMNRIRALEEMVLHMRECEASGHQWEATSDFVNTRLWICKRCDLQQTEDEREQKRRHRETRMERR